LSCEFQARVIAVDSAAEGLNVAVALNKDGAVAKTYASGIPTTVIMSA